MNKHYFLAPPAGSVSALWAPQGQSRCESNVYSQNLLATCMCGLTISLFIFIIASFIIINRLFHVKHFCLHMGTMVQNWYNGTDVQGNVSRETSCVKILFCWLCFHSYTRCFGCCFACFWFCSRCFFWKFS